MKKLLFVFLVSIFLSLGCSSKGGDGDGGGGAGSGSGPITVLSEAPDNNDNSSTGEVIVDNNPTGDNNNNSGDNNNPEDNNSQVDSGNNNNNDNGNNDTPNVNGVASLDGVSIIDGKIVIKFQGEVKNVSVTVVDNSGKNITGSYSVDGLVAIFTPTNPLSAGLLYTVTIKVNDQIFVATVMIAVDNVCQSNSIFKNVPMGKVGGIDVKYLIVNGKVIFGWKFGTPIKIKLVQVEKGATVKLTAYGTYDIPGQECQVYFQRWVNTGKPVENYVWQTNSGGVTGIIGVNAEDSSLDGDADYSFEKTYIELKIFDKTGKDISLTSKANLVVTPWPQGSSLAGYLVSQTKKNKYPIGMTLFGLAFILSGLFVFNRKRHNLSKK